MSLSQFLDGINQREKQNRNAIVQQLIPFQQQQLQARMAYETQQEKKAIEQERRTYEQQKADEQMLRQQNLIDYRANVDLAKKLQETKLPMTQKELADLGYKERSAKVSEGNLLLRAMEGEEKLNKPPKKEYSNKDFNNAKQNVTNKSVALNNYSKANGIYQLNNGYIKVRGDNGKDYLYKDGQYYKSVGAGKKIGDPVSNTIVETQKLPGKITSFINKQQDLKQAGDQYNAIKRDQLGASSQPQQTPKFKPVGKL